jgi:hypothetical protein
VVALHELDPDWIDPENDPLVRRLRDLEWAKVSPDLRARCWERISTRMAAVPDPRANGAAVERVRDIAQRYEFSRRQAPCRDAVAQAWSRRPYLRALGSRPSGLSRSALALS